MQADILIADKAFDAEQRVLEVLAAAGKSAVIPPKANRTSPHLGNTTSNSITPAI